MGATLYALEYPPYGGDTLFSPSPVWASVRGAGVQGYAWWAGIENPAHLLTQGGPE